MRMDIQGMRALSVISVILFHLGYLEFGYLGVDIFFVISGFLICGGLIKRKFDYWNFVKRRVTRILPLSLSVTLICIPMACILMLPDDLENFAASAIATVFMGNNILQLVTTANYWDVVNEFKPLLHTWSLGVEEQYYLLFPLLFLYNTSPKTRIALIALMTTISIVVFVVDQDQARNFYWLPSRVFEFGLGALLAFRENHHHRNYITKIFVVLTILICTLCLCMPESCNISKIALILSVLAAMVLLSSDSIVNRTLLSASILVWMGNISYSLYMWHQPILAFMRYSFIETMSIASSVVALSITFLLSVSSYYLIEEYFRKKSTHFRQTVIFTTSISLLIVVSSTHVYRSRGILRDYPILGLSPNSPAVSHNSYNHRVHKWDSFRNNGQTKVLCVGNSYARDFANILYERDSLLDIAYVFDSRENLLEQEISLFTSSDLIFWTELDTSRVEEVDSILDKLIVVGPKQFGHSSGRTYFKTKFGGHQTCRAAISPEILDLETSLKHFWKHHFLSILDDLVDDQNTVTTLSAEGKLISQDSRHLTRFGAQFLALQLGQRLDSLLFAHEPTPPKP